MAIFFKKIKPVIQEHEIDNLLLNLEINLDKSGNEEKQRNFYFHLSRRQSAFKQQINIAANQSEKDALLLSYHHFALAVINCIKAPNDIQATRKDYFHSSSYRHIGGKEGCFSYTFYDSLAVHLAQLSTAALLISIVIIPFYPPAGLITLGITLTVLIPTLYYIFAETLPNELRVKTEEDEFFKVTSELLIYNYSNEELMINEHSSHTENYAFC